MAVARLVGERAGLRSAEVFVEPEQRGRLLRQHLAVVVAGDADDAERIVLVRLVELIEVIGDLAGVIDDVADVVAEADRGRGRVGGGLFHALRHEMLGLGPLDAAGIADAMDRHAAAFRDRIGIARTDDVREVHPVGRRRPRRQRRGDRGLVDEARRLLLGERGTGLTGTVRRGGHGRGGLGRGGHGWLQIDKRMPFL